MSCKSQDESNEVYLFRDLQLISVKGFINKFYLILLNSKISFDVTGC